MKPLLSCISIFPVKSLDGISLKKAMVTEGGCLLHDREYAIIDENGNFIIGKSNNKVHSLRTDFDFKNETISIRQRGDNIWNKFHLKKEKKLIENYFSDYFGIRTMFLQNANGRFLDIPDISGVTVLSTSSLKTVSTWFNNMEMAETRKRFRATFEIENVPAFWEDQLFTKNGSAIEFRIGNVTLFGMSPRARCVVPTRNPETGEVLRAFPKTFAKHRSATLPSFSTLKEHGHFYFLSVDCCIPKTEIGKWIYVGDKVEIIGNKDFY